VMMGKADEHQCVLVFESIHDVMRAEKELKALAISLDLVPTPRQISSDCGMAIAVQGDDVQRALAGLTTSDSGFIGCYQLVCGKYQKL
jgi:hypothetical protein